MKVCGVIPARMASTRLPGKPLINISGKSMIQHVYDNVIESKMINKLIVATDHEKIYNHVKSFGGNAQMTSIDCQNGTERVYEIAKSNPDFDLFVNIQGDEPLINPDIIDLAIKGLIKNKNCDIGTVATNDVREEDYLNNNRVKVVRNMNHEALYFSRSAIPFHKKINTDFLIHIGLYVYRKKFIEKLKNLKESKLEKTESLEQLKFMDNGYRINIETTNYRSIGVDTQEDIGIVETILNGEIRE